MSISENILTITQSEIIVMLLLICFFALLFFDQDKHASCRNVLDRDAHQLPIIFCNSIFKGI